MNSRIHIDLQHSLMDLIGVAHLGHEAALNEIGDSTHYSGTFALIERELRRLERYFDGKVEVREVKE